MKTSSLLFLGLAALALTACEQDETNEINRGDAIGFRPAMSARSRATEITNANLDAINVAAFMGGKAFFPTTEFVKGSDGFFNSATEYYWPGDNTELTFYAYAPELPDADIVLTETSKTLSNFSPAADLASQVDFITSYATGNKDNNETSGVELTFNHQLSQIEVYAKTSNDVYTYTVSGIRIGKPVSEGSFDFTTSSWTPGTDKALYEDTYDTAVTLGADPVSVMGQGGNAMLIPQQLVAWDIDNDPSNKAEGAYLSIRLTIAIAETGAQVYPFPSNGDCDWAAIPIDTKWEPGKKYIYTLDLSHGAGNVDPDDPNPGDPVLGGPIKFTVDVTDWVDNTQELPMN